MKERVKKWTPGPWAILGGYDTMYLVGRESNEEAICDVFSGHDPDDSTVTPNENESANAAIIAAAPALVEALEDLLASNGGGDKSCGHDFTCVCAEDKAKEALSQAYGETQ